MCGAATFHQILIFSCSNAAMTACLCVYNKHDKLTKNNLKVGEVVAFNRDGEIITGCIIRLNFKSVTLVTPHHREWRVGYGLLFRPIDADVERYRIRNEIES